MGMKSLSNNDVALKSFKKVISNYTTTYEAFRMPYWVFIEDSNPFGIVAIGKEPIRFLAPPDTPMSEIRVVDFEKPKEVYLEFISKALSLSKENAVKYSLTRFPTKYRELTNQFKRLGFQELRKTYSMVCPLDKPYESSSTLRFERVQRSEMQRYSELLREFMKGNPDTVLSTMSKHMSKLPETFLDFWFNPHQFFFVYKEKQIVGVLELNPRGGISNIGVSPQHRRKGYGKQIMLFGLNLIQKEGCNSVGLRVHVDNMPAINLYKTLGFKVREQYQTLIYTSFT
jgi:GNAT superfamily N-acetyltransferase